MNKRENSKLDELRFAEPNFAIGAVEHVRCVNFFDAEPTDEQLVEIARQLYRENSPRYVARIVFTWWANDYRIVLAELTLADGYLVNEQTGEVLALRDEEVGGTK